MPARSCTRHRGRPIYYQPQTLTQLLTLIWEASGYVCSKRLAPFMGNLVDILRFHHEITIEESVYKQLITISPATLDRLLAPVRKARLRQPHISTSNVASPAHKIATHTYADLRALPIGHMETDLVLHCGMTTEGFYLTSLVGVDIVTGWSECVAVRGKGQHRVGAALEQLRRRLPFALLGIHSDNGSEFINQHMYDYCLRERIAFSHSRPYHKNDQPRVEQRNGSLVRQIIGYERYSSHAALAQLNLIYQLLHGHANFF